MKQALDISVIILTKNEEIHIERCLENVKLFAKDVFVVDCLSTDRTVELAEGLGAKVVKHPWPGNHAAQFNWALDNLPIQTEWILRLDADEYLTEELIDEFREKIPTMPSGVSAVVLPLGRAFMGRVLKHGIVNGIKMIRLFRYGKVRYEERMMDEHFLIQEGVQTEFKNKFIDDNRCSLRVFVDKHNGYSAKEAVHLLDAEYHFLEVEDSDNDNFSEGVRKKHQNKDRYAKQPLFWRSIAYFCYRYFVKLGFLDGKEGFLWDFLQGLWYRMLVDAKVFEVKKACGEDKEKMKQYIENNWNIKL